MTEHRERMERVLRACAQQRVPDTADPWPAIRERVTKPRRSRRIRLVPRTRVGWAFAALVTLFAVSTGAYAAGGITDVLDYLSRGTVPYIQEHKLGAPVKEKISRDGVTVTIDRVYADSAYVVVGFHVDGLDKLIDHPDNPRDDLFADVGLSGPAADAGGDKFAMADGYWRGWVPPEEVPPNIPTPPKGSQVGNVVFESPTKLASGKEHRFRVEVGIFHGASQKPTMPPFLFDLKIPVKFAPTIEVNQTVERNGIPVTLTRVVNSPARAYAYLCFDPPEESYDSPVVKTGFFGLGGGHIAEVPVNHPGDAGGAVQRGCATYNFGETLYDRPGRHSLTITRLIASDPKVEGTVDGPWRFHFEVPDS